MPIEVDGKKIYGYNGKLLVVDLSSNKVKEKEIDFTILDKFIGGIGLAAKIIYDNVDPRIDPLGPDNLLVFAVGPLTGTIVPTTGRYVVASKSPLTQGWGEAHAGGFFGARLKWVGYDALIIKGRASSPVYLYIDEKVVEIRDAEKVWGKNVYETDYILKKEVKGDEKNVSIATIGPAGEHLARLAVIASDINPGGPRIAGRTGIGAVMGSKNLKAIVIKVAPRKIEIFNEPTLRSFLKRSLPSIMSYPTVQYLALWGTSGEAEEFYEYGDMPIKHFTLGKWDNITKLFGKKVAKELNAKSTGCWLCPVKCWKVIDFEGKLIRMPEYEAIASLGSLLLIDEPRDVTKLYYLCNYYGLDVISVGVVIGWVMECIERGYLTPRDLDGIDLKWGDVEATSKIIEKMGRDEGIGHILKNGVKYASEKLNKGKEIALHVKGLEIPMHDPRAFKGMGLQYATSNRGACHMQGAVFRIEEGERIPDLGIHERYYRFDYKGKGRIVAIMEDWHIVLESMILCKFFPASPKYVASYYQLVTGIKKSIDELLVTGTRIFTLQRLFNILCGFSRKDDTLPRRFISEALNEGGAQGSTVEIEAMLEEYYRYRGWNSEGIPTNELLKKLELDKIPKLII